MPPRGRPGYSGLQHELRKAIARIESEGRSAATEGFETSRLRKPVTLGRDGTQLDQVLKGALRRGALHEIVAARPGDRPGDAAAASGFALALATRFATAFQARAPLVWILEDQARAEMGELYAPGLAAHGINPAHLVIVETANGQESLWAMEEALKCRAVGAVAAEIWRLKAYSLTASRRLVLAAQKSRTPGLLVVPCGMSGAAEQISSAAHARFEVRAHPGPRVASAGERMPLPGCAAWEVRALRIRAGPGQGLAGVESNRFWPVLWDHEEAYFRDALPLSLSAPARDRQNHAQA